MRLEDYLQAQDSQTLDIVYEIGELEDVNDTPSGVCVETTKDKYSLIQRLGNREISSLTIAEFDSDNYNNNTIEQRIYLKYEGDKNE